MRQRVASDLGEGSGQFDTRRSATNDHESEQFSNLVRIRGGSAASKARKMRRRISVASSIVLSPGASVCHWSLPK